VELTIRDNGRGFPVPGELTELSGAGAFGIIGMIERAQAVGGTLRLHSVPGAGTTVEVLIPAARDPND
jgi:signal transduction histidine kinase